MNTDIITLTEIQGTDSVSSSRIVINNNFKKLVKAVGDLQTRIDTSKNIIYINSIETESGEFTIKTTPNHTTRFKIDNAGNIYIGAVTLDDYIRRVLNNTKLAKLKVTDILSNPINFQSFSGEGKGDDIISVTIYYTNNIEIFTVNFDIPEDVKEVYKLATVCIYDQYAEGEDSLTGEPLYYKEVPLIDFNGYDFHVDPDTIQGQRTITISWIPEKALHETYEFKLKKIEN